MIRKLETIQTKEKLNSIYAIDNKGNGGANHVYSISVLDDESFENVLGLISFQNGARKLPDSLHGVLDCDLLEIVRDRLKSFQDGDFACEENAKTLYHVEEALKQMNKRVEDRIARQVLGENKV